MKKTKRFIGFLLVVQMMLMCTFIPGAMAADVVTETPVESENAETVLAVPTDTETEISVEDLAQDELMPMAANDCENDDYSDDYYIEGEPVIPVGAMPVGQPTIGSNVSNSFLDFVVSIGYSSEGWYYYMQDYRLPNGQLVKYHIWANDYHDTVFHHA